MKNIIIVGMGLSGNATFCQLVNHLIATNSAAKVTIKVFESNADYFATGVPYYENAPAIWTLNNSAKDFKFIQQSESLSEWMNANRSLWQARYPDCNEEYVPRGLVGIYLKVQYQKHKEKALQHGIEVEEHIKEVIDVDSLVAGQWLVKTQTVSYIADCLFLCFGQAPSYNYPHLKDKAHYYGSPYNLAELNTIPQNADIYIIGGQASFVDIVLWLCYVHGHQGRVHCVTRNHSLITCKGNNDQVSPGPLDDLKSFLHKEPANSMSFARGDQLFWHACARTSKEPIDPNVVLSTPKVLKYQLAKYDKKDLPPTPVNIDQGRAAIKHFYLDGCYQELWDKLDDEGKKSFTQFRYSQIMAYLTGISPLNARLLVELYNRGIIIEHEGLSAIQHNEVSGQFALTFTTGAVLQASYLIDTSGFGFNINRCGLDAPLLNHLATKGILLSKPHGGIAINAKSQPLTSDGHIQPNLFCIGPVASYGYKYPTPFASFILYEMVGPAVNSI